ncbi:hypothetical protein [Clostridium brassicae]|uniref:HTH cro/C1-type domain-containing protein n=1 Tax=Clostridium brassicae TaxID=2999072 RepID=A0ABT4D7M5_9CLOT|nr:hypothetical protein [Clostridium brassicae]MCY6958305.1 hypothetical protein [Clostridium brassicae]
MLDGIRISSAGGNRGINQYNKVADGNNFAEQKSQEDLANQIGIDQRQLQNYKKLNELIPKLQSLVENNPVKQGKVYSEYVKLCGITHGGSRVQNAPLTQEQIAKELGVSTGTLV